MTNDNLIQFTKLPASITAQINHSRQSKHTYFLMESLTHTSMVSCHHHIIRPK